MKLRFRVSLHAEDGTKFFGQGVYLLLLEIAKTGSLRSAAAEMDMAYSKASRILKTAEEHFGFPLTQRHSGGTGGGGSELTDRARHLLQCYEALLADRDALEKQLLERHFSDY